MTAELYIKEVEKSPLNGAEAAEVVEEGDFVVTENGGGVRPFDPVADGLPDGIVPHRERGPHIREHEQDYSEVQYEVGEGPVPFYQFEDGSELTDLALEAAEGVEQFEAVAFDADGTVVPAESEDAETESFGSALQYAAVGEGLHARLGL